MEESELIDQYVRDELNEESRRALVYRMKIDASFKSKVELREIIVEAMHLSHEDDLRTKLWDSDRRLDRAAFYVGKPFRIAASILIALSVTFGVYIYLTNDHSKISKYDLYESGIPNKMGWNHELTLVSAMNYYKGEDYSKAFEIFEEIGEVKSDTVLYFSGICAFRTGQIETAINYFRRIDTDSKYSIRSKYRLGIAYWKLNQIDLAISLFKSISRDTSFYGVNSKRILIEEFGIPE